MSTVDFVLDAGTIVYLQSFDKTGKKQENCYKKDTISVCKYYKGYKSYNTMIYDIDFPESVIGKLVFTELPEGGVIVNA